MVCAVRILFVPIDSLPDPVDVCVVFLNTTLQSLSGNMDILPSSRQDSFHLFMHRNTVLISRCGMPQVV
jgi:hypothetical protein